MLGTNSCEKFPEEAKNPRRSSSFGRRGRERQALEAAILQGLSRFHVLIQGGEHLRVYECDGCQCLIRWKEGQKSGDPPPITVRGQGLVLDFCSIACMGEWGTRVAEATNSVSLKQRQDTQKGKNRGKKETS